MTPDFFLTPAFLVSPAALPLKPSSGHQPPGIALVFRRGDLWLLGMDHAGRVHGNRAPAAGWGDCLSLHRLPGRATPPAPRATLESWYESLWHAEKACVCATRGDWEGVGVNADRCQGAFRAAAPPDAAADYLYADARLAGAWGGMLVGGELSLWSPPGCSERLDEIVRKAGGERVATRHAAD
jgi:hypothetical protein